MAGLTWIHLSDWHQKGEDFDRKIVRDALMKDIQNRKETIHSSLERIDFIIFSGDLAYHGETEEYKTAQKEFLEPLLQVSGVERDQIFIVPGNHDLNRDKLELVPGDLLGKFIKTPKELQNWLTDDDKRDTLLKPMKPYCQFLKEFLGENVSGSEPAYAYVRQFDIARKKVALIGLNSAWLCARIKDTIDPEKINDYGHLIIGELQAYEALDKASNADIKIAVMHHSFFWLTERLDERRKIREKLGKYCHFILHGHEHCPEFQSFEGTGGNYIIIPAGACYDRREPDGSRYSNSYNFVHLNFKQGTGDIYFRRYEDRQEVWIRDAVTTGDKTPGNYTFPLSKIIHQEQDETQPLIKNIPATYQVKQTKIPVFEWEWIERVSSLVDPESRAITVMAVAYRRMTPEIFHHLTGMPIEICKKVLLENLRPLSFIKYKEEGIVLLREDMRQRVLQFYWENHDPERTIRKAIANDLLRYYDENLLAQKHSKIEQEVYTLEALEYALWVDPKNGLNRFRKEFDNAIEGGRYDYCKLLFQIAQNYHHENPFDEDTLFSIVLSELQEFFERPPQKAKETRAAFQEDVKNEMNKITQQNLPIRILHLSDLHFGSDDNVQVKLQPLIEDLQDQDGGLGVTQLDYLVISGDLTKCATPEEFGLAREFIDKLIQVFSFTASIIVPGNHDQSWERLWRSGKEIYRWRPTRMVAGEHKKPELKTGDGYLVVDHKRYTDRFQNFSNFFETLTGMPYPLEFKEQCQQYLFEDTGIQFITLNSCWEIDELFQDRASIHEEAIAKGLENARKIFRQSGKNKSVIRIAVLHHPPVAGIEGIKNDEFVEQLKEAKVALILHGHVHENKREAIGYERKQVHIVGAGSFGAPAASRPESTPRLYNLLEIQRAHRCIRVYTRHLDKPTGAWRGWGIWRTSDPHTFVSYYDIPFGDV